MMDGSYQAHQSMVRLPYPVGAFIRGVHARRHDRGLALAREDRAGDFLGLVVPSATRPGDCGEVDQLIRWVWEFSGWLYLLPLASLLLLFFMLIRPAANPAPEREPSVAY
jgi:hypothetical protein